MSSTIVIASPSPTTSQPATLSNAFVEFDDHVSVDEYQHHLRQLEHLFECDSAGGATNQISRLSQAMIQHFAQSTSTIDTEVFIFGSYFHFSSSFVFDCFLVLFQAFIKSMCVVSRFHIQSYYLHALQSNWSEWCCVMDAIHDKFDMILTLDSIVPRASTTVVPPQLNVPSSSSCSESHSTNVIADSALRSDILFLVVSIVRGWLSLTDFDRRLVSLLTSKSSVAHICHTVCVVVHHIVDIGQAVCARTSTQLLSLMWPQSPDSFVWSDVTQSIQAVLRSVSAQLALMLLRCVDRAERRRMFAAMERVQSVLKALTVEPLK
jgi:hypothetical protein